VSDFAVSCRAFVYWRVSLCVCSVAGAVQRMWGCSEWVDG